MTVLPKVIKVLELAHGKNSDGELLKLGKMIGSMGGEQGAEKAFYLEQLSSGKSCSSGAFADWMLRTLKGK